MPLVLAAVAAVAFAAVGFAVARWMFEAPRERTDQPIAFTIALPAGAELSAGLPVTISPDGRQIVIAATLPDGRHQLFSRTLDRPALLPLAGTENATSPFFSPDGTAIGFFADGRLKRVPAAGGVATVICAAPNARGGAWGADDRIVFAPASNSGLSIVTAGGGTPQSLTSVDENRGETSHRWPTVLPDASGVIFTVLGRTGPRDIRIAGVSLRTKARHDIKTDAHFAQYAGSQLVYVTANGEMFRAPFDRTQLNVSGPAAPLPERPVMPGPFGAAAFAISSTGTLVLVPFERTRRSLVVVKGDGAAETLSLPPRTYTQPQVSFDGRRVAIVVEDGPLDRDVWLYEPARETLRDSLPTAMAGFLYGHQTVPPWHLPYQKETNGSW